MKRIFVVFIALALAACAAPPAPAQQPTAAPPEPTQTPVIIVETVVETVVVTVIPTDVPTLVPTASPLPPPTEVPASPVPAEATQPPAAVANVAESTDGSVSVDDSFGASWFTNLTRTRNDFSLRCQLNKVITFSVKPTDPNITQVDFYYRIEDRATGAVFDWQNAGRMIRDANGGFTLAFSGEQVHANFRKPNAWFDYQFIGSNGSGVVGRSEKIQQQVSYTFDCPQ